MAFLKQWPVPGWKSHDAASKPYVAVDSQGNVFATDPAESRLLAFDPGGRVQYFIRALGARHGTLNRPTGVAADPADDSIWIGDSGNDRIVRLRLKTMARNRITGE
jgi:streptogramin lyase